MKGWREPDGYIRPAPGHMLGGEDLPILGADGPDARKRARRLRRRALMLFALALVFAVGYCAS